MAQSRGRGQRVVENLGAFKLNFNVCLLAWGAAWAAMVRAFVPSRATS
jgi:hypothetical protein